MRVEAAWLGARLTVYAPTRAANFTPLDKLIDADRVSKPRQTPEQRLAAAAAWADAMSRKK